MRLLDVIALRIGHRGSRIRGRLAYRILWRICVAEKTPTRR
jgi:hypothetical protein